MSCLCITPHWCTLRGWVYWTYQECLFTMSSTIETGGMPAVLHTEVALGPMGPTTEYISLQEMKQDQCICPLSWSVHCNFTGDGKCNKRGWAFTPHPHQPKLILPSWLNVRQKAAVSTLCTLWDLLPRLYSLKCLLHGHFEEGATLQSPLKRAALNRANESSGIFMQF